MSRSAASTLAGQSAFFLAGNVFTLIAGFTFQVYLANQLGADGLGLFGLYEASISVVAGLLSFGLAPSAVKFIPHYLASSCYPAIRRFLRQGFKLLLIAGCSGYVVILVTALVVPNLLPEYQDILAPLPVMGLMLPLGLLLFFTMQALRGFHDIRYMVMGSSFLQLTVKIILSILLFSLGLQLIGYIWAVVLSTGVALLWMLKGLNRHDKALPEGVSDNPSAPVADTWHGYAKVMYGNSLLATVAAPLDRFLVGFFVGASGVGVLMTVKVLQGLPGIFLQMFLAVVAPMFSEANAKKDFSGIQKLYCITTDWLMRLSLPLLIFLAVLAGPVLGMYGEAFQTQGAIPLYILLFAQLINLGCGPIGNVLNMAGQEAVMFRISIIQTIISVVGLTVLTPFYGLVGASVAILAGIAFVNIAALYVARKKLSLRWSDKKYLHWLVPVVSSVAFCIVLGEIIDNFGKFELLFYLVCNYLVFHLLHIVLGVNEDDREVVREFRKKFIKVVPGTDH